MIKQKIASLLYALRSPNIGHYLWVSGRCAVAHAYAEPLVDPEDPEDSARLQKDLPLVKALAEHLIEHELGVKSMSTIWREHLYELSGFHRLLGVDIVAKLKAQVETAVDQVPNFP